MILTESNKNYHADKEDQKSPFCDYIGPGTENPFEQELDARLKF